MRSGPTSTEGSGITNPQNPSPLELWGGIECTVNRVGDRYFDQIERSGHASRIEDLDLIAGLGIRTLRYPVLWERTAPDGLAGGWRWADERLKRLRELGIRPIVGLLHHGSGPRHTSLVTPGFAEQLAEFAGRVAERYPWVDAYTPVNEPLTTARFSALYGHWYPHARDPLAFARALLAQCRAVALSMRAVRAVNPGALLVQTEDLGRTFSTRPLEYQAEFENERRWLTWDLLCGRVAPDHPMWSYLRSVGVAERDLGWFLEEPSPPDVIGVNHYITSERFLDHRFDRYPAHTRGGNGRDAYADVAAVRAVDQPERGPLALLRQIWERYSLPLAVTETHMGCTREEQMRWVMEVWSAAETVRAEGAELRAVTAWSLLGAYDWNSLLTRDDGRYEPGAFDVRGGRPRRTALAGLIRALAAGATPRHPVLAAPGWWRRPGRFLSALSRDREPGPDPVPGVPGRREGGRPLVITGATGTLGAAFGRLCEVRGLEYRLLSRGEMDIADRASVERALSEIRPWAVVNTAGYVRVDDAEREPERCGRENAAGPAVLAEACAGRGVALVTFSSDLVFDGRKAAPYVESDPTSPLNEYGRSKAEAEWRVLRAFPEALVIRTSAFFGPWDTHNFVTAALAALGRGETFRAADDTVVSPTYVPDLVHATLDLLLDSERGIWHLANPGAVTWAELARIAARRAGLDPAGVEGCPACGLGLLATRPTYGVLGSERAELLPPLNQAIDAYFEHR